MKVNKDFVYQLRKIECEIPYLIVVQEYPAKYLKGYVKMLTAVPFIEFKYNVYYGEIRKIIYSYLSFYNICIGHACKKAIDTQNTLQYDTMIKLFDRTVSLHEYSQQEFLKDFQPIESPEEQEKLDTIILQYNKFKEELLKFGEELKGLTKQDKIDHFAKDHFKIAIEHTAKLCEFSHIYISKWLADQILKIRISLEDILHRIRTNYTEFQKSYEDQLNILYNELYDLNKENLEISRRNQRNSEEAAANTKNISIVRNKIREFGNYHIFGRLDMETTYWTERLANFEEIALPIAQVKTQLEKTKAEQEKYDKFQPIDPAGFETHTSWQRMGENLARTRAELEEKFPDACRPLISFFNCRGIDRILYSDNVGSYFIDEYGHQNYITHYGAKFYHVTCQGEFVENCENEQYYFDQNGRYVVQEGKKVYQLAPCTSLTTISDNGQWTQLNPCTCSRPICNVDRFTHCSIEIHNLTDVVLLPKTEPTNIESTLEPDAVKYLWDCYGWILPEVLCELAKAKPKNPIHYFGHLLLNRSHSTLLKEMKERKKGANKYRDDIIQQRKDEMAAKTRAWRAKMVKPRKASHTSHDDDTFWAYQANQENVTDQLMFYD